MKIKKSKLIEIIKESIKNRIDELSPNYVRNKISDDKYNYDKESKRREFVKDDEIDSDEFDNYSKSENYIFDKIQKFANSMGFEIYSTRNLKNKRAGYESSLLEIFIVNKDLLKKNFDMEIEKLVDLGILDYSYNYETEPIIQVPIFSHQNIKVNKITLKGLNPLGRSKFLKLLNFISDAYNEETSLVKFSNFDEFLHTYRHKENDINYDSYY